MDGSKIYKALEETESYLDKRARGLWGDERHQCVNKIDLFYYISDAFSYFRQILEENSE